MATSIHNGLNCSVKELFSKFGSDFFDEVGHPYQVRSAPSLREYATQIRPYPCAYCSCDGSTSKGITVRSPTCALIGGGLSCPCGPASSLLVCKGHATMQPCTAMHGPYGIQRAGNTLPLLLEHVHVRRALLVVRRMLCAVWCTLLASSQLRGVFCIAGGVVQFMLEKLGCDRQFAFNSIVSGKVRRRVSLRNILQHVATRLTSRFVSLPSCLCG